MSQIILSFLINILIGIVVINPIQALSKYVIKVIFKFLFNYDSIKYLLLCIIAIIVVYYYFKFNINIMYCTDEDTTKRLGTSTVESSFMKTNINNNVNVKISGVNDPNNLLNKLGASGAFISGMKMGSTIAKSSTPLRRAGAAIGMGVVSAAAYGLTIGRPKFPSLNYITNNKTNNNNSPYNSYSTLEPSDNTLFSIEDLIAMFDNIMLLKAAVLYLFYTLTIFILTTLVNINKPNLINNYVLKKLNNNFLNYLFNKLFSITIRYNIIFSYMIILVLIVVHILFTYFLSLFKLHLKFLCKLYLDNKSPDSVICSNIFINTNINDYLNNEYIMNIVSILVLIVLLYSFTSNLIYNKVINLHNFKDKFYYRYIKVLIYITYSDGSTLNIIFMFIFISFLLISSFCSCYYWYWFINDFYYIACLVQN